MSGVLFRAAARNDLEAVAQLHRYVRETCLPYLPQLHTPAEDLAFFRDHVFPNAAIVVAQTDIAVVGYAARREGWLDHLYVHPRWQGRGIGSELLARAKEVPDLHLWVFQRNVQAREFYERHGFRLVTITDGSANEENEPDALYRWQRD